MDPNATLADIRESITDFRNATTPDERGAAGFDLIDAVEALDEWLRRGGFLPGAWNVAPRGLPTERGGSQ